MLRLIHFAHLDLLVSFWFEMLILVVKKAHFCLLGFFWLLWFILIHKAHIGLRGFSSSVGLNLVHGVCFVL